jgi:hypothetical protein
LVKGIHSGLPFACTTIGSVSILLSLLLGALVLGLKDLLVADEIGLHLGSTVCLPLALTLAKDALQSSDLCVGHPTGLILDEHLDAVLQSTM